MPRTVIFAVICTLSYGVGALVMLARFVSRLADSSDYYALFANLLTAFVLVGTAGISLYQARGLVRRQERARKSAFSTGLIMTLVWGVLVLTAVVMGLALRRYAAILEVLALMLAPGAPFVATAWSLSRPSAKAWFASAADAQAARR